MKRTQSSPKRVTYISSHTVHSTFDGRRDPLPLLIDSNILCFIVSQYLSSNYVQYRLPLAKGIFRAESDFLCRRRLCAFDLWWGEGG